jgi:hypothetical protein
MASGFDQVVEDLKTMTPMQLDVTAFQVGACYRNKHVKQLLFIKAIGIGLNNQPEMALEVYGFGYHTNEKLTHFGPAGMGKIGYADESVTTQELPIVHFDMIPRDEYESLKKEWSDEFEREADAILNTEQR